MKSNNSVDELVEGLKRFFPFQWIPQHIPRLPSSSVFKVAVRHYEPASFPCVLNLTDFLNYSDNCTFPVPWPGYDNELLGMILSVSGIKYELVKDYYDMDLGLYNSSTRSWTGLQALLYNGTVDILNTQQSISEQRTNDFDISVPLYQSEQVFVMRKPNPGPFDMSLIIFRVFAFDFYVTFAVTVALLVFMLYVSDVHLLKQTNPVDHVLRYHRLNTSRTRAGRNSLVLMLSFLLCLTGGLYQGSLLAKLLIPARNHSMPTFEELVHKVRAGAVSFITDEKGSFYEMIAKSNLTDFHRLREAIRENPLIIEKNRTRLLDLVETADYVYPAQFDYATTLIRDRCKLTMNNYGIYSQWRGFMLTKGSAYKDTIDQAAILLHAYGLTLIDKYSQKGRRCVEDAEDEPKVRQLKVVTVAGALILLVLGWALSCGALGTEMLNKYYRCTLKGRIDKALHIMRLPPEPSEGTEETLQLKYEVTLQQMPTSRPYGFRRHSLEEFIR